MSTTSIEWTRRPGTVGAVWNIVTGCNKVDRGCKHCYAQVMHNRLQAMGQPKYAKDFLDGAVVHPEIINEPATWKKARTVFVNSMSDLFHEAVPFEFLELAFGIMDAHDRHTYLILTKRPERALAFWYYMRKKHGPTWRPRGHVWLGTSINDQESAELRVPILLAIDTPLRFVSYEPATGAVNLTAMKKEGERWNALTGSWTSHHGAGLLAGRLDWVIMGGESGPKATPMHPDWAREMRDDCQAAKVPFFFKQWGAWEPVDYQMMDLTKVGAGRHNGVVVSKTVGKNEHVFTEPERPQNMRKTQKKNGNELDGHIWQEFP